VCIQITHRLHVEVTTVVDPVVISGVVDVIYGVGDEQTSQQTNAGTSSKHARTAHTASLFFTLLGVDGLLTVSTIGLPVATSIPWTGTVPPITRAVA